MSDKSSFKGGSANGSQQSGKVSEKDSNPKDEYYGGYKPTQISEEEAFGGGLNPVKQTPTPFKGLKNTGG